MSCGRVPYIYERERERERIIVFIFFPGKVRENVVCFRDDDDDVICRVE
jgi:hypothetical protein